MGLSDATKELIAEFDWESRLAERTQKIQPSFIREILKLTARPEIISFAGGLPAPDFFPVREFEEACRHILQTAGKVALQYSPTEGYTPLKKYLAETMSKYEINVELENILIVSGSQQGLDLLGKLFINPDGCILCSRPTYLGALQAWNAYQAHYCSVPLDEEGMCVDEIPKILEKGHDPRFVYVLPNFHNPAGTTLPLERRKRLVEIARQYDLVIIEDDPYGELRYEGEDVRPIFRLAPERTIYLSTFSKTLSPGIRLAWVVAPKPFIARLVQAKQGADLHTGTFVQMVASDICERGILRQHVKRLREVYRIRRDLMMECMLENWPQESSWTKPQGGLFLWAQTPEEINTKDFFETAVEAKVAYVPGNAFYPYGDGGDNSLRLNFSNASEEMIHEGIYRLGRAMKEEMAKK
ncbi:MAG: aminotransferase class I/II-fold pyridoxal phosphate-dependent enzyme [Anaerolineales bacterium]|nr:aminotransferase class I/II-fold pyridoxal phosphate-dependent enzyme [Anaerolineales bacterium]